MIHNSLPPGQQGGNHPHLGTTTISTSEPPVLQVCKSNTEKLWTVLTETGEVVQEETHIVYSLPSIPQTITHLHAAAGYPVKDTWINIIKVGNFVTWPGLTAATVRKHFPESDETEKDHIKKQHQGVRSTKIKEEELAKETIPD
jgi:hypothetical protein